jgi:hypothetical protein
MIPKSIFAILFSILFLVGCSSVPNRFERAIYDVQTNHVGQTESYELVPKAGVVDSLNTAATVSSAVPGWGTVATSVLGIFGAAYHGYTRIRFKKTAAALVQGIETGREIISKTPNGDKLDAKYVEWLEKHQAELGVVDAVTKVVANVDPAAAQHVANAITAATQPRPTP